MRPGDSPNLILAGFMGTGKTTVGRDVARRLGRLFVDTDAEIESRLGKSVARIFAEDGAATFRRMEAALCHELAARSGLVIAAGGGALLDPASRRVMLSSGTVLCLMCDAGEVLQRLAGQALLDRPLLAMADPAAEVERLLAERREAYAAIPWRIDTTGLGVDQVADRVLALAGAVTLAVHHPGGEYPIHVGAGLLAQVGFALRAAGVPEGGGVAIVSNPNVAPLYGAQVESALHGAGLQPVSCSIPNGEQHKTLATVAWLYEELLSAGLDRGGTVLSLGGGVTGDVAGFAAATYLRGVRFVQVPTTILAMVDAAVGGKTGVDLRRGKNLVGAFKQPVLVLVDPDVLSTLPPEEIRSGMAEVIKHGIIGDACLFSELESQPADLQHPLSATQLLRALNVKVSIVEQDPFERGRRTVLNLGHTLGHGLELLNGFAIRHGDAVGIGMMAAARIAVEVDLAHASLPERIGGVLEAWGLPVRCPPYATDAIWEAMTHDKKRQGRSLRWVLPRAVGDVETVEGIPASVVNSVLQSMGAR